VRINLPEPTGRLLPALLWNLDVTGPFGIMLRVNVSPRSQQVFVDKFVAVQGLGS